MKLQKGHWVSTKDLSREDYDKFCKKLMEAGCKRGEYCEFTSYELIVSHPDIVAVGWSNDSDNRIYHAIGYGLFKKDMELTIKEALGTTEETKVTPIKTPKEIMDDFELFLKDYYPRLLNNLPAGDPEVLLAYQAYHQGYFKRMMEEVI